MSDLLNYTDLNGNKANFVICDWSLGRGSASTAYQDAKTNDVYLVCNPDDESKKILCQLQGMPHIPKMEYVGQRFDGKYRDVYKTKYSITPDDEDERTSTLSKFYDCDDEFVNTRIRDFMNSNVPESFKVSLKAIFDLAFKTCKEVVYDLAARNLGIDPDTGEILLRDIVYMTSK